MRCEHIMKRNVECVSPGDSVQTAAMRMRDQNIGFLPVCEKDMKVLGTITDRDLTIRVLAEGRPAATRVQDVMTGEPIACRPQDELRRAEELMGSHQKSRIMCVNEDGVLAGIISLSDIAQQEKASRAAQTMRDVSQRESHA
jgi:CBS domain-containing protein